MLEKTLQKILLVLQEAETAVRPFPLADDRELAMDSILAEHYLHELLSFIPTIEMVLENKG